MPAKRSKSKEGSENVGTSRRPAGEYVDMYVRQCREYDVPIDPSVVVTLTTDWHTLHIREHCREGCLLPLLPVLREHPTITTIIMCPPKDMGYGAGDTNMKVLATALRSNHVITDVRVPYNGITVTGISALAELFEEGGCSLTKLELRHNHFGSIGGEVLAEALLHGNHMKRLDVSHNVLGFRCTQQLSEAVEADGFSGGAGNYVFEEVLNSVTHGVGVLLAIVGTCFLLWHARTRAHFWSSLVYGVSLITLYLSSTLYHSFFFLPSAHHVFQILDHSAIYLLIAGSYTPFCAVGFAGLPIGMFLLALEWLGGLVGIAVSVYLLKHPEKKWLSLLEVSLYVGMGYVVVFAWPHAKERFGDALPMLVLGGAAYTCGVVFFLLDHVHPLFHTIFHIFVLAGSICHYYCITVYVVQIDTPHVWRDFVHSVLQVDCDFVTREAEMLAALIGKTMGCNATQAVL